MSTNKELSSLLLQSFQQAIESSFVEDSFVFNGKTITLRSLSKAQYDDISAEMARFERKDNEGKFVTEFCIRHLYRAIVEFGGVNLRGVKYLHVEDGKPQVETAVFLRDNFLSKLSFESFGVLWDKFSEVVEKAETLQRSGVTFTTPQERPDEKITRLLEEASELLSEVPEELVKRLLDKNGFPVAPSSFAVPDTDPQEAVDTDPPPPPTPSSQVVEEYVPPSPPVRDASSLPLQYGSPPPPTPVNLPPLVPSLKTQQQAALENFNPRPSPSPQPVPVDRAPKQGLNPRFQPPTKMRLVHASHGRRRSTLPRGTEGSSGRRWGSSERGRGRATGTC